jgi:hypothetical protein
MVWIPLLQGWRTNTVAAWRFIASLDKLGPADDKVWAARLAEFGKYADYLSDKARDALVASIKGVAARFLAYGDPIAAAKPQPEPEPEPRRALARPRA